MFEAHCTLLFERVTKVLSRRFFLQQPRAAQAETKEFF